MQVRNPFALREALQIVLEVTWPDLPPDQVDAIRAQVGALPTRIHAARWTLSPAAREALRSSLARFNQSRASYWLREDLSEALQDLKTQLA